MAASTSISAAVLGASGYTGMELIRWLVAHPDVRVRALGVRDPSAWDAAAPHLAGRDDLPRPGVIDAMDGKGCDVVFSCLPHGASAIHIARIEKNTRVIDLSADLRLKDTAVYRQWYGQEHPAKELLDEAVYGLSEWNREAIRQARIIANPGCYPTCVLLALAPLIRQIDPRQIIIHAISGISGAGRSPRRDSMLGEVSIRPYAIAGHRHLPEIEGFLEPMTDVAPRVEFVPHITAVARGMCVTIHATTRAGIADLQEALRQAYRSSPFVTVIDSGDAPPATSHVLATNECRIGVWPGRSDHHAVIVSVIDNLGKGAAGQAVQNMNILFSLDEDRGLKTPAIHP